MVFLNPTYLWAFLGLMVPVAIHLWNKKDGRTIQIGSVYLLEESDAKQSKQIEFSELWLLLLRLLVLGILVLILAAPQITKKRVHVPITYIVEPDLLKNERIKTILDTIGSDKEIRILGEGLPKMEDWAENQETATALQYWQWTKTMETLQTDSIVVFTQALLSGVQGIRPKVDKKIDWIIVPADNQEAQIIAAAKKEEMLELLSVSSSGQHTFFEKEYISLDDAGIRWNKAKDSFGLNTSYGTETVVALSKELPIQIQLFCTDSLVSEKKYMEAAFNALSAYLKRSINLTVSNGKEPGNSTDSDLTIWLSGATAPKSPKKILIYKPDPYADRLIKKGPLPHVFHLTAPLNTENTLHQHFTEELLGILDLHKEIEEKASHLDQRQVSREELLPRTEMINNTVDRVAVFNLSLWLWPVLMLLLIVERILSKLKKQ